MAHFVKNKETENGRSFYSLTDDLLSLARPRLGRIENKKTLNGSRPSLAPRAVQSRDVNNLEYSSQIEQISSLPETTLII